MTDQIVVKDTVLPTTLAAALRYTLAIAGPFLIAKGVPEGSLEGITLMVLSIASVVYGLWKTHQRKKDLIVTAEAAPNSVAVVVK